MKYIYAAVLLLALHAQAFGKHIFFEIDDVLFKVSEMETIKNIPVLAKIGEKVAESYTAQYLEILSHDHTYDYLLKDTKVLFRNKRVPSLLCAFFLDMISAEEAGKTAVTFINENVGWYDFIGKTALRYAAQAEFDPKHEINYMFPVHEMHALVEKLARNPENKLYIFSNKNPGTLKNLKNRYPKLFAPFNGRIIISGETKLLKPHANSYEYLFSKFNINPTDAYFVEAQRGYIDTVRSHTRAKYVRWTKDNIRELERELLGK